MDILTLLAIAAHEPSAATVYNGSYSRYKDVFECAECACQWLNKNAEVREQVLACTKLCSGPYAPPCESCGEQTSIHRS